MMQIDDALAHAHAADCYALTSLWLARNTRSNRLFWVSNTWEHLERAHYWAMYTLALEDNT